MHHSTFFILIFFALWSVLGIIKANFDMDNNIYYENDFTLAFGIFFCGPAIWTIWLLVVTNAAYARFKSKS